MRGRTSSAARLSLAVAALVTGLFVLLMTPGAAFAGVTEAAQWQLSNLHAKAAWKMATGAGVLGRGVVAHDVAAEGDVDVPEARVATDLIDVG